MTRKITEKNLESAPRLLQEDIDFRYKNADHIPGHIEELQLALGFASTAWDQDGVFMAGKVLEKAEDVEAAFEQHYDRILESQYIHKATVAEEYVHRDVLATDYISQEAYQAMPISFNYDELGAKEMALIVFAAACKQRGASQEEFVAAWDKMTAGRCIEGGIIDARWVQGPKANQIAFDGVIGVTDLPKQPDTGEVIE